MLPGRERQGQVKTTPIKMDRLWVAGRSDWVGRCGGRGVLGWREGAPPKGSLGFGKMKMKEFKKKKIKTIDLWKEYNHGG